MTKSDGIAEVQYFEHDSFVGTRRMYCCGYSEAGKSYSAFWPHTAYFCPKCGDLWGRAIYSYQFDYQPIPRSSWVVESRPCVGCGDGQFLYAQSLEGCSPPLLLRELAALLEGTSYEYNRNFPAADQSQHRD